MIAIEIIRNNLFCVQTKIIKFPNDNSKCARVTIFYRHIALTELTVILFETYRYLVHADCRIIMRNERPTFKIYIFFQKFIVYFILFIQT